MSLLSAQLSLVPGTLLLSLLHSSGSASPFKFPFPFRVPGTMSRPSPDSDDVKSNPGASMQGNEAVAFAALSPAALVRCAERTERGVDAALTWVRDEALRARMPQTVAAWQALNDAQVQEKMTLAKEGGQEAHFNMWHASTLAHQLTVLHASSAAQQAGRSFDDATALHAFSCHHADLLKEYALLGCFHCQGVFSLADVEELTDRGQTALCPLCGIDAVIPLVQHTTPSELKADGGPMSRIFKLLQAMHSKWFEP